MYTDFLAILKERSAAGCGPERQRAAHGDTAAFWGRADMAALGLVLQTAPDKQVSLTDRLFHTAKTQIPTFNRSRCCKHRKCNLLDRRDHSVDERPPFLGFGPVQGAGRLQGCRRAAHFGAWHDVELSHATRDEHGARTHLSKWVNAPCRRLIRIRLIPTGIHDRSRQSSWVGEAELVTARNLHETKQP